MSAGWLDVWRDTATLLRQHATLASWELSERTKGWGIDAALLVIGAVVLQAAVLLLLATAVLGLSQVGLAWWQAGLVVAAAATLFGVIVIAWGRARLQRRFSAPSDTLAAFEESWQWMTGPTQTRRR